MPTRINIDGKGSISKTCTDHFFTSVPEKYLKAVSVPVGFSDHNIIALALRAKVPKAGLKVIYKRMYKKFSENDFVADIKNINWITVLNCSHVEAALLTFMNLFSAVYDKHAPIKKCSIRSVRAPWIDTDLRYCMKERDRLKKSAIKSGSPADWKAYRSLRNKTTKMNRQKKKTILPI